MKMEGFEFSVKGLGYFYLEDVLCRHYGLGTPSSSSFMELTPNKGESVTICGTEKSMSCYISNIELAKEEGYKIFVGNVNVSKNKGW